MSDGGRDRASLGVEVWKSSQKRSAQRSAVRSLAWLGVTAISQREDGNGVYSGVTLFTIPCALPLLIPNVIPVMYVPGGTLSVTVPSSGEPLTVFEISLGADVFCCLLRATGFDSGLTRANNTAFAVRLNPNRIIREKRDRVGGVDCEVSGDGEFTDSDLFSWARVIKAAVIVPVEPMSAATIAEVPVSILTNGSSYWL